MSSDLSDMMLASWCNAIIVVTLVNCHRNICCLFSDLSDHIQNESEKADPERLSKADNWKTCGGETKLWCGLQR